MADLGFELGGISPRQVSLSQGRSQKFVQGGADIKKGKHQSHKRANTYSYVPRKAKGQKRMRSKDNKGQSATKKKS